MQKILSITFTLLLCFISLDGFAQLRGDSFSRARQTGSAKFYYVFDGVPGFVDKEENGNVEGFLVDIMKQFEQYVKNKHGINVSSEFMQVPNKDFKIFMADVKNGSGGVFGLSNVSIKEERKKDYRFSPPYMKNVSVLITNAKTPTLINIEDIATRFRGKKAYSVSSSTYYERLDEIRNNHFPGLEIVSLPSVNEVMEEVISNDNAFAVIDLHYYLESLKNKFPIKRHSAGDKGGDRFGVIMPLSNDWEPVITEFFDSGFIGGVEYRKIVTENLGKGALRLIEQSN